MNLETQAILIGPFLPLPDIYSLTLADKSYKPIFITEGERRISELIELIVEVDSVDLLIEFGLNPWDILSLSLDKERYNLINYLLSLDQQRVLREPLSELRISTIIYNCPNFDLTCYPYSFYFSIIYTRFGIDGICSYLRRCPKMHHVFHLENLLRVIISSRIDTEVMLSLGFILRKCLYNTLFADSLISRRNKEMEDIFLSYVQERREKGGFILPLSTLSEIICDPKIQDDCLMLIPFLGRFGV